MEERDYIKKSIKRYYSKRVLSPIIFIAALILDIILLLVIVAMLIITLSSDNPNVLNYEYAVQNKYAQWEQDLTERERQLKLKEKELGINLEGGSSQETEPRSED